MTQVVIATGKNQNSNKKWKNNSENIDLVW